MLRVKTTTTILMILLKNDEHNSSQCAMVIGQSHANAWVMSVVNCYAAHALIRGWGLFGRGKDTQHFTVD